MKKTIKIVLVLMLLIMINILFVQNDVLAFSVRSADYPLRSR